MALSKVQRRVAWGAAGLVLLLGYAATPPLCLRAYVTSGIAIPRCPDGRVRQTVLLGADGLRRGESGWIRVAAIANYTEGAADSAVQAPVRRFEVAISLVGRDGAE